MNPAKAEPTVRIGPLMVGNQPTGLVVVTCVTVVELAAVEQHGIMEVGDRFIRYATEARHSLEMEESA